MSGFSFPEFGVPPVPPLWSWGPTPGNHYFVSQPTNLKVKVWVLEGYFSSYLNAMFDDLNNIFNILLQDV
jgi:hypothetical protein